MNLLLHTALGGCIMVALCCSADAALTHSERQGAELAGSVEIQMRNVNFRIARDIVLEVHSLRGRLKRTKADLPVTFDDSASFYVDIDTAEVAISAESLTALLNSYVLNYEGAPIRDVT